MLKLRFGGRSPLVKLDKRLTADQQWRVAEFFKEYFRSRFEEIVGRNVRAMESGLEFWKGDSFQLTWQVTISAEGLDRLLNSGVPVREILETAVWEKNGA